MNSTVERNDALWARARVRPLWENARAHNSHPPKPRPMLWAWHDLAEALDAAAAVVSTAVAERRVLSLVDPQYDDNGTATVRNFNGGLQILLPGESARPHRHSMNAIRFVLDGGGAVTRVNGAPAPMSRGDLILTPAWTWHEHVHDGSARVVWLDVLDAQLHRYLETDAFQPGPIPPATRLDASPEAVARWYFPWQAAADAVAAAPPDADGVRRYAYPLGAAWTMDCALWQLDAGVVTPEAESSAHVLCAVVEGEGITTAGDATFRWQTNDVFTLPKNVAVKHEAGSRVARLFVVSDGALIAHVRRLSDALTPC